MKKAAIDKDDKERRKRDKKDRKEKQKRDRASMSTEELLRLDEVCIHTIFILLALFIIQIRFLRKKKFYLENDDANVGISLVLQ